MLAIRDILGHVLRSDGHQSPNLLLVEKVNSIIV